MQEISVSWGCGNQIIKFHQKYKHHQIKKNLISHIKCQDVEIYFPSGKNGNLSLSK